MFVTYIEGVVTSLLWSLCCIFW